MQDFRGKVAVITGGASGIGRALAEALISEGARIVLADIEESALMATAAELSDTGADVHAIPTDSRGTISANPGGRESAAG